MYCGTSGPDNVSARQTLTVRFKSLINAFYSGFSCSITATDPATTTQAPTTQAPTTEAATTEAATTEAATTEAATTTEAGTTTAAPATTTAQSPP